MKSVVVTGVSSGIGEDITRYLVSKGFHVFGSVRKPADAAGLQNDLGDNYTPLIFDVTDSEAIAAAVATVQEIVSDQGLAGLVNNSGINLFGSLVHQPLADIRYMFEVNVFGAIAVTQAFLPLLGAVEGARFPPGRIVNIGSVSGAFTVPFNGGYSGTKHAMEAVTQAFRRELIIYGIDVSIIEPGVVRSKTFEKNAKQIANDRSEGAAYVDALRTFGKAVAEAGKNARSTEKVCEAVYKSLTDKSPRTRNPLDFSWWLGRILPDRLFDKLIFRSMGLEAMLKRR